MRGAALAATACALLAGCSHDSPPFDRSVPIGSRSSGEKVADVPVRGHVITVQTRGGEITGELLAVGPSELILLAKNDGRIVRFSEVRDVDIALYPSRSTAMAVWTGIGAASTVTHGVWALISMPVWLISGIRVTAAEQENIRVEGVQLDRLYQYARFPQGLPDVTRSSARQRPPAAAEPAAPPEASEPAPEVSLPAEAPAEPGPPETREAVPDGGM